MSEPALIVDQLETVFFTKQGAVKAVDRVSFSIEPGKILGLVGESGSGKSVTGFSIMGLVDPPGRVVGGRVLYNGTNLVELTKKQMRSYRGSHLAMIFQDPMMTLNPVLSIETQIIEAITAHKPMSREAARQLAITALEQVGIPSPEERLAAYPHQFSGGMRQRVVIAIALLHRPNVIIADEATTALDLTIQGQILYEVQKLCELHRTALIWITHDLSVVAGIADEICVMYAGKIVERGSVDEVLDSPMHPYTQGLINSVPSQNVRGQPLDQINGTTPSFLTLPKGCAFRTRCSRSTAACRSEPALESYAGGREVRCFHPHGLEHVQ